MLHQFFLTYDCLYILMAEKRKELANFDYWLNIINILGKNTEDKTSPVLLLFNEINIDTVSNFTYDEKKYTVLFPDMKLIKLDINFMNISDGRFECLVNKIKEKIINLEHIGKPVPAKWVTIRTALEAIKNKKFMTLNEYFDLSKKSGIEKKEDSMLILKYFHMIGIVLHFSDDINLSNTIFLNPNWTVDAVYSILSDKEIEKNQGIFKKEDVDKILLNKGYQYFEIVNIMQLMLKDKFDLCYKLPGRKEEYIIPLLLYKIQPEYNWDFKNNLQFRFQYPFMPKGIVSRLIVRLNEYIDNRLVWSEGVVFQRFKSKAQVIEKETTKEGLKIIDIRLSGNPETRMELLTLIREEIKKIQNSSFPNLPYSEMVPCNCIECIDAKDPEFYDYQPLKHLLSKNVSDKQCPKSGSMVKISKLIDVIYNNSTERKVKQKKMDKKIIIKGGQNYFVTVKQKSKIDIHDITNNQLNWENIQSQYDLKKLGNELKTLKERLRKEASTSVEFAEIALIAEAEQEANKNDGSAMFESLKKAGKWTFDIATKIGTTLAADVLKKAIGL